MSNFLGNNLKDNTPAILVPYSIMTVFSSIANSFLMFTPSIVVEMVLKDFSADCEKKTIRFENTCRNLLSDYEKLEKALGNFFLCQFTSTQLVLVLCTFLRKVVIELKQNILRIFFYSISEFFTEADNVSKLSSFFNNLLMVCMHSSNLNVLTRHIDQAFQSLQILKRRILEEYFQSTDEKRHEYFYLLKRVEMLRPMSGDGYFEITKTTITSMISVRLCILDHIIVLSNTLTVSPT